MFPEEEFGHFIDQGSSHFPRENQRKRQKNKKGNQKSNRRRPMLLYFPLKSIVVTLPHRKFPCQISQLRKHHVAASYRPHLQVVDGSLLHTMHQLAVSFTPLQLLHHLSQVSASQVLLTAHYCQDWSPCIR